jgi:hypothetical protein
MMAAIKIENFKVSRGFRRWRTASADWGFRREGVARRLLFSGAC